MKAARGKKSLTYKGRQIRFAADPCTETWQARKEWQDIFNVLNQKNMQPRILSPARLSFKIDGEIKSFPDQQKLKEFMTTKPALQEILGGPSERRKDENTNTYIHTYIPKATKIRKDQRTPPETPTLQAT